MYYLVQGVKCEGCLNDVKNRMSGIENITGVSVQFQHGKEPKIADLTISARYQIPQQKLQVCIL